MLSVYQEDQNTTMYIKKKIIFAGAGEVIQQAELMLCVKKAQVQCSVTPEAIPEPGCIVW